VHAAAQSILETNATFYDAFAKGDVERVLSMLADGEGLAVMHPGWPPVRGRESVVASWRDVLEDPPPILCADPVIHLLTSDVAVVTCLEVIEHLVLAATNVWVRQAGAWRLVHHQAGEAPTLKPVASLEADPVLH
jgi:ketosteroid isomerase-like protein